MPESSEIIARAEQLFLRVGIRSVTMDDIASDLGISKKTLYHHFSNKDELVEEVISTYLERDRCIIESICQNAADALDEIRNIGIFVTTTIEHVSAATLYDLKKYYRGVWEMLMQKQDERIRSCIAANLKRGIREGLYRPDIQPEIVAQIYTSATKMVLDALMNPGFIMDRRALIAELHDYHIHAIATSAGLERWKQHKTEMNF